MVLLDGFANAPCARVVLHKEPVLGKCRKSIRRERDGRHLHGLAGISVLPFRLKVSPAADCHFHGVRERVVGWQRPFWLVTSSIRRDCSVRGIGLVAR